MTKKKTISRAKADLIIKDIKKTLGDRLKYTIFFEERVREALEKHFDIVEIDYDEIECSEMGDGFAV